MTTYFDISVIGSGGVGKSCISIRFLMDEFTENYDPTIGIIKSLL
jgi:GTPase KRas protein